MSDGLNQQGLQDDIAELEDLERAVAKMPDEILTAYARMTGRAAAPAFRRRMVGALRAARELAAALSHQQPGPTRARLLEPLQRWRATR